VHFEQLTCAQFINKAASMWTKCESLLIVDLQDRGSKITGIGMV